MRFCVRYQIVLLLAYFAVYEALSWCRYYEIKEEVEGIDILYLALGILNFIVNSVLVTSILVLFRQLRVNYLTSTNQDTHSRG